MIILNNWALNKAQYLPMLKNALFSAGSLSSQVQEGDIPHESKWITANCQNLFGHSESDTCLYHNPGP